MGAGIAQVSAGAGHDVLLSDIDIARAEAGKAGIAKGLDRSFAGARVQVRRNDGAACFEAELDNVIRSGPTYFRATN